MGRRIVSSGCHPAERKNDDFAALRWLRKMTILQLFGGCHLSERSWMEVGHVSGSFILSNFSSNAPRIAPFSRVYDHSLPHSRLATELCGGCLVMYPPIGMALDTSPLLPRAVQPHGDCPRESS
ncbi:unnamed protein product [Spirodela intermedia]|uniref:Uncharacterized protein n=1 Tax=Spirodela intermedia TaxID=51605 RepID=A0A7I8KUA0_SPIIN|nr:unnamed protein product [Spirodela intermedia]